MYRHRSGPGYNGETWESTRTEERQFPTRLKAGVPLAQCLWIHISRRRLARCGGNKKDWPSHGHAMKSTNGSCACGTIGTPTAT